MNNRRSRKGLAGPYIRLFIGPFFAALACLSVEAACDLLQPALMAQVVDRGVAAGDAGTVARLGLLMLGGAAVGALAAAGRNVVAGVVSHRFGARLRADLFRRITSFSFRELDGFDTASLVTRQTNDVTQVQTFVNGIMRVFVKAPIVAIGALVMAWVLEPGLFAVLLVTVPAAAALILVNLLTGFPRFRRVQEALDGVNSVTREYLGGIRVVKAFGRERLEADRFARANAALTGASTFALRVMALFGPAVALVLNLGIAAVLWIGGYRTAGGSLQAGTIIAFISYMIQLLFALNMISGIFAGFVRAKASWERVGDVLALQAGEETTGDGDAPPAEAPPPGTAAEAVPAPGKRRAASVEFRGVSFAYPLSGGRLVLEDVSLLCEPGRITAVIGPTGSGKSTLAALVPRFYPPTSGAVLVDGIDAREIPLGALRRRIALVPQKTVLFSGAIAENLRWGREEATDGELEEACRAAAAHDFIAGFPEGYRSALGRGGVNLSGGQRQRVSIARALVRRPEVLILDDCTSSVDSVTEAEILRAIRGSNAGFTCILITQRISAAAAADRVLVLEEGRAAGVGRHAELMKTCAVYRDIGIAQLGKEIADG